MSHRAALLGAAGYRARNSTVTPTVRSAASNSSTATSFTVAKPSGLAVNDYLIAWFVSDNDSTLAGMGGPWSLFDSNAGVTSGHPYEKIFSKVATSTETGASTFTFTNGSTRQSSVVILAITAGTYSASTPITAVTWNNGGTGLATAHVAPSVTGVVSGLLLTSHATDSGGTSASYTPPSGMAEQADTAQASAGYTALEVCSLVLASTAATGTKTATCSVSRPWKGASLIVNPGP